MSQVITSFLGGSIVFKIMMDGKIGPFKWETITLQLLNILLQLRGRKKYEEVLTRDSSTVNFY